MSCLTGIFSAYFAGGLILAAALTSILGFFAGISEATWNLIQVALGVMLIGFAAYLRRGTKTTNDDAQKPKSLSPQSTFWLGFAVTASDLPTAVPYIAAIERMLQAELSLPALLFAVTFYNLIYVLPLLALFGIYLFLGDRGAETLQKISRFIERWSSPALALLSILAGLILIADGTLFYFGSSLF